MTEQLTSETKDSIKTENTANERTENFIVLPPDGGWGWIVVMGAFCSFLISDGEIFSFGIFLNEMSKTFNCSKSQVSLTGAIMIGFFCLTGPCASALVNQFGFRKIAVFGSLVASASCILTSISPSIYVTFLTYGALGGFGFGLIYISAILAVGFYFEKWRGLATAIAVCGGGIGGIAVPPLLSVLLHQFGWRQTFMVMACLNLVCVLSGLLYKPLKPIRIVSESKEIGPTDDTITEEDKRNFFARLRNTSHPTIADIQNKSYSTRTLLHADSSAKFHVETTSSMTIYTPQNVARNISSEFIMSSSPAGPASGSKSSFRSSGGDLSENFKNTDSRLSTVYEETKEVKGRARKLYEQWFNRKNKDSSSSRRSFINCKTLLLPCITVGGKIKEDTNETNNENVIVRPLYRDDIFYSASLMFLPEYRKSMYVQGKNTTSSTITKSKSIMEYSMLVTRAITEKELREETSCKFCSEPIKRTLATMLDLSLLKSPSFILLTLNAVFTSFGFYTPYMFIEDRAIQCGVRDEEALWLISCIGFTNTLGRIGCGILSSLSTIRALNICYVSLLLGGISTSLYGLTCNAWAQFAYAAVYGLSIASISALRTIIMVEMLGLEKLTNAMGIILMFQGVASLIGTSASGLIRDITGDYQISFYSAGASITIGALLLIPIRAVSKWEKKSKEKSWERLHHINS